MILGKVKANLEMSNYNVDLFASKITGMLIYLSVFEIADIMEMLDDDDILNEWVSDAIVVLV